MRDYLLNAATDPEFFQQLLLALGIIVAFAIGGRLLLFFLSNTVFRLTRRTKSSVDDVILNALKGPLVWLVTWMGVSMAYQTQDRLLPADWEAAFGHLLFIGYTLIITIGLYRLLTGLIDWYMREMAQETESTFDDHLLPFLHRLLVIVLIVSAIVLVLQDLNQPVGSLIATLGVGSLAVALAAQSTLSDIISGFLILIDRRYRIGDRIELINEDVIGDVQDIGLRTTRLLTMDYRMVIIPNSMIAQNMVINHAYPDANLRVDVPVGIAYGEDVRRAKAVLLAAIRRVDGVHQARTPDIVVTELGDNAINLEMRVWIPAFADKPKMVDRVLENAYDALNEAGIEIPFPQRTVWHRVEREAVPYVQRAFTGNGTLPALEEETTDDRRRTTDDRRPQTDGQQLTADPPESLIT